MSKRPTNAKMAAEAARAKLAALNAAEVSRLEAQLARLKEVSDAAAVAPSLDATERELELAKRRGNLLDSPFPTEDERRAQRFVQWLASQKRARKIHIEPVIEQPPLPPGTFIYKLLRMCVKEESRRDALYTSLTEMQAQYYELIKARKPWQARIVRVWGTVCMVPGVFEALRRFVGKVLQFSVLKALIDLMRGLF